jgi:hypothetical protein
MQQPYSADMEYGMIRLGVPSSPQLSGAPHAGPHEGSPATRVGLPLASRLASRQRLTVKGA